MKKHFSILFAIAIFAALSLFARPIRAQATVADSMATLVYEDSRNAHEMATVALNTVGCLLEAETKDAKVVCMTQFEPRWLYLGGEHKRLHEAMKKLKDIKRS